jgi:redox-sensitive bicupin YhaK (pirin superfamily)
MIEKRKASGRYQTRLDWLDSRHSFSFGHHYDAANVGHGPLRVLNEDWIAAKSGFPTHPHREMEILTYVLFGTLAHRDSEGNEAEIRPGRTQLMHAGTGIAHSEFNRGQGPVHLLQIWIEPRVLGALAGYEMLDFDLDPGAPAVLVSPDAKSGGLPIRQDATVSALKLEAGQSFAWSLPSGRRGWVQIALGAGQVGAIGFEAGDGFALDEVEQTSVEAEEASELLLFDLPGQSPRH